MIAPAPRGAARSLRARLVLIILPPLLVLAAAVGLWQLLNARQIATEINDRRLLLSALAVSTDVALSEGEALSAATRALLVEADAPVFYHVYAPDGAIVIGYATPPVGIPSPDAETAPTFFRATYLGRPVNGVRIRTQGEIDGISGRITTTVWQQARARDALVATLMRRTFAVIGLLVGSVALVVWFGVRRGLRPLDDLEAAVARRSSDDLSPIRRPVPPEVAGVVARLNALFLQVERSLTARSEFVANAAHQLRNPVAGILSLADAVRRAPDADSARARAGDLHAAARETAALTEDLLLLERASVGGPALRPERVALGPLLGRIADAADAPPGTTVAARPTDLRVEADATMLSEALSNLVDNAARHGGPGLRRIDLSAARGDGAVRVVVADDGGGVAPAALPHLTERFRQGGAGPGAGLGLSIAAAVAEAHGGRLHLASEGGFVATIVLPDVSRGGVT